MSKRLLVLSGVLVLLAACPASADSALELGAEYERLAAEAEYWPGFEPLDVPLAVYANGRTYLFRHPGQPDGFAELGEASANVLVHAGRHSAVTANSSADIGGIATATLLLDGVDRDELSRIAAVGLHEAFHVYQHEHHPGWFANEGDLFLYPVDDGNLLALRRLETAALDRAFAAIGQDDAASNCWAFRALEQRRARYAELGEAFVAYERGTELAEGLARYVEARAVGPGAVVYPAEGFAASDVRNRAYTTGATLALLLDRVDGRWRNAFSLGETSLDAALRARLPASAGSGCRFTANEAGRIREAARRDARAVAAERIERRRDFDTTTSWRVVIQSADNRPLWPQAFDPLNVTRVEGGILHTRYLEVGNDSGSIEMLDADGVDLTALTERAGEHPLFNGIARVTIVDIDEPEVTVEGEHVTLHAAGFRAEFRSANLRREARTVVVSLR